MTTLNLSSRSAAGIAGRQFARLFQRSSPTAGTGLGFEAALLRTSMITQEQFKRLLPLACTWAEEQERIILRDGASLSSGQTTDALKIGVAHPERIKLLKVARVPIPEHPALRAAADATQLISPRTGGLTLRYGIFIRADCWGDRRLVFHELVHTLQYERLGGFQQFLQQYLYECITIGYPAAPMEQEAITTTARLCD